MKELMLKSHQTQTSTIVSDSVLEKSMVNKCHLLKVGGRCGRLMVSAPHYRSSSLGPSPGQGHSVVLLGKTVVLSTQVNK